MVEMHVHDGTCTCNSVYVENSTKLEARTNAEFSHEHNILNISHPNKPENCQKCGRNHPGSVYESQVFDCKARVFRF